MNKDAEILFHALYAVTPARFPIGCGDILPFVNAQLQFEVLAAHVHETAWQLDGQDSEQAVSASLLQEVEAAVRGALQEVEAAVRSTGFTGELRGAKLYDVYSSGSDDERRLRLQQLIQVYGITARSHCIP